MLCEERERNTSQVRVVSRCHEETWGRSRPCTGQEKGGITRETAHYLDTGIRPKRYRESVRSLSDIAVRHEVKERKADARPQASKNRRRIRWNTVRILGGREQRRCLSIVRRSRTVTVGQAPRRQGQEDLDTNREAAGQKTGRGGLPTQGRGQREYSHHA